MWFFCTLLIRPRGWRHVQKHGYLNGTFELLLSCSGLVAGRIAPSLSGSNFSWRGLCRLPPAALLPPTRQDPQCQAAPTGTISPWAGVLPEVWTLVGNGFRLRGLISDRPVVPARKASLDGDGWDGFWILGLPNQEVEAQQWKVQSPPIEVTLRKMERASSPAPRATHGHGVHSVTYGIGYPR